MEDWCARLSDDGRPLLRAIRCSHRLAHLVGDRDYDLRFVDDPRRLGGLASALYDDEGSPTASKTMIERGVVKEFFYDAYTAARDGRAGNASA